MLHASVVLGCIFFFREGCSHFSRFLPGVILAFSRWKFPFLVDPKTFQWSPKCEKKVPGFFGVVLHFLFFIFPFHFFLFFFYFFDFLPFSPLAPITLPKQKFVPRLLQHLVYWSCFDYFDVCVLTLFGNKVVK